MATKANSLKENPDWSDAQKRLFKNMGDATLTAVSYAAKEIPPLGNKDAAALLEELGPVNEAKKAVEKVEKILKERTKALLGDKKELRSDNFEASITVAPRVALNQGAVKEVLEQLGDTNLAKLALDIYSGEFKLPEMYRFMDGETSAFGEYMDSTEVATFRIKGL